MDCFIRIAAFLFSSKTIIFGWLLFIQPNNSFIYMRWFIFSIHTSIKAIPAIWHLQGSVVRFDSFAQCFAVCGMFLLIWMNEMQCFYHTKALVCFRAKFSDVDLCKAQTPPLSSFLFDNFSTNGMLDKISRNFGEDKMNWKRKQKKTVRFYRFYII